MSRTKRFSATVTRRTGEGAEVTFLGASLTPTVIVAECSPHVSHCYAKPCTGVEGEGILPQEQPLPVGGSTILDDVDDDGYSPEDDPAFLEGNDSEPGGASPADDEMSKAFLVELQKLVLEVEELAAR